MAEKTDITAYDCFSMAMDAAQKGDTETHDKMMALFKQAVEEQVAKDDENFVPASDVIIPNERLING